MCKETPSRDLGSFLPIDCETCPLRSRPRRMASVSGVPARVSNTRANSHSRIRGRIPAFGPRARSADGSRALSRGSSPSRTDSLPSVAPTPELNWSPAGPHTTNRLAAASSPARRSPAVGMTFGPTENAANLPTGQVATCRRRPARCFPRYAAMQLSRTPPLVVTEIARFVRSLPLCSVVHRSSPLADARQAIRNLASGARASQWEGRGFDSPPSRGTRSIAA